MSLPVSEIVRVLAALAAFPEDSCVSFTTARIGGGAGAENAGCFALERRAFLRGDAGAFAALVRALTDAVQRDAGSGQAEAAEERLLQEGSRKRQLACRAIREILHDFLPEGIRGPLDKFTARMPADTLSGLHFTDLSLPARLAVLGGVETAGEMMREINALADGPDSPFSPVTASGGAAQPRVSLPGIRQAQKVLATGIRAWGNAVLSPFATPYLPPKGAARQAARQADSRAEKRAEKETEKGASGENGLPPRLPQELPLVLEAVRRLLQVTRPKLLLQFIDTLTGTAVSDVLTLQRHVATELESVALARPLPGGLDAVSYAATLRRLHELLFEAVCRHISYLKGVTVRRLVEGEAAMLLQSDPRLSLATLLRLYFNDLLADLPDPLDLKARASVKGFDQNGVHGDFVRDCIARRDSFAIEGVGILRNALDREKDVASGRRDLEFFEQRMEAYAHAVAAWRERVEGLDGSGAEAESPAGAHGLKDPGDEEALPPPPLSSPPVTEWERPDVRPSPALTPEDLKAARDMLLGGIPDITRRMAVTALANQGALKLVESFFGKDSGSGVAPQGAYKHLTISFRPDRNELAVQALILYDELAPTEGNTGGSGGLGGQGPLALGDVSFTQIEYTVTLRARRASDRTSAHTPEGKGVPAWRAAKVTVDSFVTSLAPGDW